MMDTSETTNEKYKYGSEIDEYNIIGNRLRSETTIVNNNHYIYYNLLLDNNEKYKVHIEPKNFQN